MSCAGAGSRVIPVEQLYRFLAGDPGRVVLRNADVVANLRRGGDVDVLVADLCSAEEALLRILGFPHLVIRRSYVTGYFYEWGHIDLLPRLEWRGAEYLSTPMVLAGHRRTADGTVVPRLAHEALVCWLASLLPGGFFNHRYQDLIIKAAREDGEAFRDACLYAAGKRWGERLWAAAAEGRPADSVAWRTWLRRAVWWRAFRRDPSGTARRHAGFWSREIRLRLTPPLPSVALLGPDGSGKSSIISAIASRLGPPRTNGVHVCHWRPGRFRRPAEDAGPVTDPHARPPRGLVVSTLKLAFLAADWLAGYWGALVHRRAKGQLLIFDRHYLDILVDPRRYRYGGSRWLAALLAHCIPRPDVLIVLDAPVDVLRRRKQEVSAREAARQRQAYRELATSTPGSRMIDAGQPLDGVVDAVERVVFEHLTRSTRVTLRRRGMPAGHTNGPIDASTPAATQPSGQELT